MPNLSQVHVDQALTNFALKLSVPAHIAERVFPRLRVRFESNIYYKFVKREELHADLTRSRRAPGAAAAEMRWDAETDSYLCIESAWKHLLPDRIVNNSDSPVRPRARTTEKLTMKLMLGYEKDVQALAQDTAALSGGAVAVKWDAATGDPEKDIDSAKELVKQQGGMMPNAAVMSGPSARALRRKLKEKSSALTLREEIEFSELPNRVFGLEPIVADSIEDTANYGQAASIADVWNDNVVVAKIEPRPGLDSSTFGITFTAQPLVVKSWRKESRKGEFIEVSWIQDPKRTLVEAATLLEDTIT